MAVAVGGCIAVGGTTGRKEIVITLANSSRRTVAISSTCSRSVAMLAAVVTEVVFGTTAFAFVSALSVPATGYPWITEDGTI